MIINNRVAAQKNHYIYPLSLEREREKNCLESEEISYLIVDV